MLCLSVIQAFDFHFKHISSVKLQCKTIMLHTYQDKKKTLTNTCIRGDKSQNVMVKYKIVGFSFI